METLTKELKAKFLSHLEDIRSDFEQQEIQNCIDILNEKEDGRFSELDNTLLTRIIDDDELNKTIANLTDVGWKGNVFE